MKPVLEVVQLRVDDGGVPQVDGLSFATTGDRVLVLAGASALFRAAVGVVRPRHGELRTDGLSIREAVATRVLAGAPLDPPMPPAWTISEYVRWSARLAGHSRADAEHFGKEACSRMKLEALAGTRLKHAPLAARRATSVAAAMATGATTLFVEDPLRDLPEETARTFARVLVKATAGLRMVLFAGRASLSSPISMDADEAVVLDGSLILGQGAPAEVAAREHCYSLRVHGRGARFAQLAEERGARVSGSGARWTVDLGTSLRVTDMIDVAMASDTVILELRPLAYAFA